MGQFYNFFLISLTGGGVIWYTHIVTLYHTKQNKVTKKWGSPYGSRKALSLQILRAYLLSGHR